LWKSTGLPPALAHAVEAALDPSHRAVEQGKTGA
jgi:hypothetical protein